MLFGRGASVQTGQQESSCPLSHHAASFLLFLLCSAFGSGELVQVRQVCNVVIYLSNILGLNAKL